MTTNCGNQETLAAKRPVAFGDYQFEIYAAGLSGTLPSLPMVYAELEAFVRDSATTQYTATSATPGNRRSMARSSSIEPEPYSA